MRKAESSTHVRQRQPEGRRRQSGRKMDTTGERRAGASGDQQRPASRFLGEGWHGRRLVYVCCAEYSALFGELGTTETQAQGNLPSGLGRQETTMEGERGPDQIRDTPTQLMQVPKKC